MALLMSPVVLKRFAKSAINTPLIPRTRSNTLLPLMLAVPQDVIRAGAGACPYIYSPHNDGV